MLEITKPTFIVDEKTCLSNIERMAVKADSNGLRFRPHFKTHQSSDIGQWFRSSGVSAITVSSVSMATYFSEHGWDDITIAFPVNLHEIGEINRLAGDISLNLLVDNEYTLSFLSEKLTSPAGVYLEIDTGYHRTGIEAIKIRMMDRLLMILKKNKLMTFRGFLSHTGQTYAASSREEIISRHTDGLIKMRSLKEHYLPEWPEIEVSLGDTPACSVCVNWDGADEIRPGNFVFYDLMQLQIGSCAPADIAASVVCPVVSRSIVRSEAVIYGGAVHLSKEFVIGPNGKKWYGGIAVRDQEGQMKEISETLYVSGLSQEHGIIKGDFEEIRKMQPGDLLEIIPVHSCLAADLAGAYFSREGKKIRKMAK